MAGLDTHDRVEELVRDYLPRAARVADLAAGQGAFSERLADMGHSVVAIDFTSENWKSARVPLLKCDLDSEFGAEFAKADNRFDAVVAIEIIEHLENPFRFVRECAKMLRPGGLIFLTTPNVEAVNSRLIFLYSGRMSSFGEYETVRPAHITPIFGWKLEMILAEAGFQPLHQGFTRTVYTTGTNLKGKIAGIVARLIGPLLKGSKGGEGRVVVARLEH
jgi:2-polyprenyl-3-methyl-5-hydroxy-6-metoxy-1,4-benzoquinol methylase